jgi:hypothetical protein
VKPHSGALEADPWSMEAHPGALEADPGPMEAHPGAVEVYLGEKKRKTRKNSTVLP